MSMNKVIIIGKVSKDPNLEYTALQTAVCTLSVETEEEFYDKNKVKQFRKNWSRVVAFGKLAEQCKQELKIGSDIYCEGKLHTRNRNLEGFYPITEVVSRDIQFLDKEPLEPRTKNLTPSDPAFYTTENVTWGDDEIPF